MLRAVEDGLHTPDIFKEGTSKRRVGTREFTREVIARLGEAPRKLVPMAISAPPRARAKELVALEKWSAPPQEKVLHGVDVRGHNTDANKADEEFGISCLAQHYRLGRVRLPWKGEAKLTSLKLVDEVTRYPHGRTADCVMAQWFFEWNLPELSIPADTFTPADIPAWVMASSF